MKDIRCSAAAAGCVMRRTKLKIWQATLHGAQITVAGRASPEHEYFILYSEFLYCFRAMSSGEARRGLGLRLRF